MLYTEPTAYVGKDSALQSCVLVYVRITLS